MDQRILCDIFRKISSIDDISKSRIISSRLEIDLACLLVWHIVSKT